MKFSKIEIIDLVKAWVAVSIAFGALLSKDTGFLNSVLLSAFTVGIGFLLHELGHKLVAQRYGYWAEFRSFDYMLILAILFSFFGFVFAAPGAVMFRSFRYEKDKVGKISVAGPIVNIILALIFLLIPGIIGQYGFNINSWLALFNMIPLGPFDGAKVFKWSKLVYCVVSLVSISLFFFV